MITTSVRGHLATQDFAQDQYGWSACDPIVLFEAPITTSYRDDMVPLERLLKQLSRQATALILWLDCDREGEAIGKEVQDVCCGSNPRLQVFRARFSTVLRQEITNALHSLGRLNMHWVHAVETRSELDLRVGAAFTRFQTLRLQRKFQGIESVISYGPCQFPTLGFVVERWARIETFVPEPFWFIELSMSVDATTATSTSQEARDTGHRTPIRSLSFTWKRGRLYDQLPTLIIYESCLQSGPVAVVKSLEGRSKNKWRPVPLNTVELQKRASRFLRIGSETLMGAAEELYQQGYISYPRTETEKFTSEFAHRPLIQQFTNTAEFGEYATKLIDHGGYQTPRAGQHDDQAHPPITPCKAVDPNTIGDLTQRRIYTLVVKHYLACCSRDAVGKETTLTVQVGSEEFVARGLMILERNWLEVYHPWERWSTGQGELPRLQVGSRIVPSTFLMKEGSTTAPQPISEVELISLMDRHGIGTDATIAQHITTIQEREYARKDGNQRFLPTPLGIALVAGYNSMGYQLNKPDLRRETEAECNDIAAGQKTKEQVLAVTLAKMRDCYVVATRDAHKLDEAMSRHFSRLGAGATQILRASFSTCGVCRNQMSLRQEQGRNSSRKLLFCDSCQCGWALPVRGVAEPKTVDGAPYFCPICNFQVVRIAQGEGYQGTGYHVCPKCLSDPPVEYGGSTGDFRCFSCQHPTCALASGTPGDNTPIFGCPFCSSQHQVCLRKNSRGFVLSCNKYVPGQDRCSYTIWLPKEAQSVEAPMQLDDQNSICTRCSTNGRVVRKIRFVWKPGSVPPHMDREIATCLLCDSDFRQEMRITLPQPGLVQTRPVASRSTQGRGGGGRRRIGTAVGARGGRGRGAGGRQTGRGSNASSGANANTCYRCGQAGHFANNCPMNT
jgi:DNA topoisomerase III